MLYFRCYSHSNPGAQRTRCHCMSNWPMVISETWRVNEWAMATWWSRVFSSARFNFRSQIKFDHWESICMRSVLLKDLPFFQNSWWFAPHLDTVHQATETEIGMAFRFKGLQQGQTLLHSWQVICRVLIKDPQQWFPYPHDTDWWPDSTSWMMSFAFAAQRTLGACAYESQPWRCHPMS